MNMLGMHEKALNTNKQTKPNFRRGQTALPCLIDLTFGWQLPHFHAHDSTLRAQLGVPVGKNFKGCTRLGNLVTRQIDQSQLGFNKINHVLIPVTHAELVRADGELESR